MARTRPTRVETRRKVLDAAIEVFGERGIAGTSLEQVAAHAGLTKGAVYSNFTSKNDLVFALMEEQVSQRITASLAEIDASRPATEVIDRLGAVMVQEICSYGGWHRLLAEYASIARRDETVRAELQARRREVREMMAHLLNRIADKYESSLPMPADDMAVVILALGNGLALEADIEPEGVKDGLFAQTLNILAITELAQLIPDDPSSIDYQ